MVKRLASLFLCAVLITSMFSGMAFATDTQNKNPFTDVKETDWYYESVQYVKDNGIFSGVSKNTFEPNTTMTRGMFVTVLGRMAGVDVEQYSGKSEFTDVSAKEYYAPYVAWASKHGITSGTGDGKFSPNDIITRQQMAVFFARYFNTFNVSVETGTEVKGEPADISKVADYAKESVMFMWGKGLLNGDGTNFDPEGYASRAQTATLCMRTNKAVKIWYKEPGVPSVEENKPENVPGGGSFGGGGSSGGGGGGGGSEEKKYKVIMVYGDDWKSAEYEKGTIICDIPMPKVSGYLFNGWYYDEEFTKPVKETDTLKEKTVIYAKLAEKTEMETASVIDFISKTEVSSDFTFKVKSIDGSNVDNLVVGVMKNEMPYPENADIIIKNITEPGLTDGVNEEGILKSDESLVIESGVVRAASGKGFSEGHTYQIEILNENVIFDENIADGVPADENVRFYNFIVDKKEVINVELDGRIKYLPVTALSSEDGEKVMEYAGLYTVSYDGEDVNYKANGGEGSFVYDGTGIEEGDILAVYDGKKPDERGADDRNQISYLKINNIEGNVYSYSCSDYTDVLLFPDVFPVDTDGDDTGIVSNKGGELKIEASEFDFTAPEYKEMGLDADTTIDKGDFIGFYTGEFGDEDAENIGYGKIVKILYDGTYYTITYVDTTEEEVLSAMELNTQSELTKEEAEEVIDKEKIKDDITAQLMNSGFIEETGENLLKASVMSETVQEHFGEDVTYEDLIITYTDGTSIEADEISLMGADGKLSESAKTEVNIMSDLVEFKGKYGVRVEVKFSYSAEMKSRLNPDTESLKINISASFEEETYVSFGVNGETIWKVAWIIPYIYDYRITGKFEVGTHVAAAIHASVKTNKVEQDFFDKLGLKEDSKLQGFIDITKDIEKAVEKYDKFVNGEDGDKESASVGSLADKYVGIVKESGEDWIDIVKKKIFEFNGAADPLHILAFGVDITFLVRANVNAVFGATFDYQNVKSHEFSFLLFRSEATYNTADKYANGFDIKAYIMGFGKLQIGVKLRLRAGLIDVRLASIGVGIEGGLEAGIYGYAYWDYVNKNKNGKVEYKNEAAGALYLDFSLYFKVTFEAGLLNDDNLTWAPTLYSTKIPILSIGKNENVFDFAYDADDSMLTQQFGTANIKLSNSLFDMKYISLSTGDIYGGLKEKDGSWAVSESGKVLAPKNYDANEKRGDNDEKYFDITLSNPDFTYNPVNNTLTVNTEGKAEKKCTLTISWVGDSVAFSTSVPKRVIDITWSDPEKIYYIQFNSEGGSYIPAISGEKDDKLNWPQNPVKQGYTFAGWYVDEGLTTEYSGSTTVMPDGFGTGDDGKKIRLIELFAKWVPAPNVINVDYYHQNIDGTYSLKEAVMVEELGGNKVLTEDKVNVETLLKEYTGFTYNPKLDYVSDEMVRADGNTKVSLYYTRNKYKIVFDPDAGDVETVYKTVYYEGEFVPINLSRMGYDFAGWENLPKADEDGKYYMPATDVTVTAKWTPSVDTPYVVAHYTENLDGSFEKQEGELLYGETGAEVTPEPKNYLGFIKPEAIPIIITPDGKAGIAYQYKRNSYTITWKGTEEGFITTTVKYGAEIADPDYIPERYGYTFDGWDYEEGMKMPYEDISINAKWALGEYEISFDLNGGKGELQPIKELYEEEISAPVAPTRPGYNFAGWMLGNSEYVFTTMPGENITLKAKWEAKDGISYTVNHYQMETDGSYSEEPYETETQSGKNGAIVYAGIKNYQGFSYDDEMGVLSGRITVDENETCTLVLKVYYARNDYKISFDLNGGEGEGEDITALYDADISELAPEEPTRPGYNFAGWYDKQNKKFEFEKMPLGGAELTAKWTERTDLSYTVEYYKMDSEGEYPDEAYDTMTYDGKKLGEEVSADISVPVGFRLDDDADNIISGNVSVDENGESNLVLKVYYARNEYTISFIPAEGESETESITALYGAEVEAPDEPAREGYTFTYWHEQGNNEEFEFGTMPAKNLKLYASWECNDGTAYSVWAYYMDKNGAYTSEPKEFPESGTTESEVYLDIEKYGKEHFTFDEDNEENILEGEIAGDGSLVLKAYYKRNQYTVSFDLNGAEGEIEPIENVYYEAELPSLEVPEWPGYNFAGWFMNGITVDVMPGRDITLSANWEAKPDIPYTVTLYKMNAEGEYENAAEYNGKGMFEAELDAKGFEDKEGFELEAGFELDSEETEDTFVIAAEDNEFEVYYKRNSYEISFDLNGGTGDDASITALYGAGIDAPEEPARPGYTFNYWEYNGIEFKFDTMPLNGAMLTAKWTANNNTKYTVEHYLMDVDGENYTLDKTDVDKTGTTGTTPEFAPLDIIGFEFENVENSDDKIAGDGSTVYRLYYTRKEYTITFDSAGGTAVEAVKGRFGAPFTAPANPTRVGNNFKGWTLNGLPYDFTTIPAEDITLKAVWKLIEYKIKYNANGGTFGTSSYTDSYTIEDWGKTITPPTLNERIGYGFSSWSGNGVVSDPFGSFGLKIEQGFTGDITLEAIWAKKIYSIKLMVNGTKWKEISYTITDEVTLPEYSETGYTFKGWTKTLGSGNYIGSVKKGSTESMTLHADGEYTVTLNPNGGQVGKSSIAVEYGKTYGTLPTPTRTNYTFEGWYTQQTGGEKITSSTTVNLSKGQTLYAHWRANAYTVIYDANGGSGSMSNSPFSYGATGNLKANGFTRKGYIFMGWSKSMSATTSSYSNGASINYTPAYDGEEIILYAVWKKVKNSAVFDYSTSNGTRDVDITGSGASHTETMEPGFNKAELKEAGYTKLSINVDFDMLAMSGVHAASGGDAILEVYSANKLFEHNFGKGIVIVPFISSEWVYRNKTFDVPIDSFDNDCTLKFKWINNVGTGGWRLGATTITVTAI